MYTHNMSNDQLIQSSDEPCNPIGYDHGPLIPCAGEVGDPNLALACISWCDNTVERYTNSPEEIGLDDDPEMLDSYIAHLREFRESFEQLIGRMLNPIDPPSSYLL